MIPSDVLQQPSSQHPVSWRPIAAQDPLPPSPGLNRTGSNLDLLFLQLPPPSGNTEYGPPSTGNARSPIVEGHPKCWEDESPKQQWCFEAIATLTAKTCSLASDVISAIDFDESGSWLATGGMARKVRICSYASIINQEEAKQQDEVEDFGQTGSRGTSGRKSHCKKRKMMMMEAKGVLTQKHDEVAQRIISTPAKLSSLKWRPSGSNVLGCGDYDGVVTEWDVEHGVCLCERYEHSGQRIWSIDYSSWFPTLCVSASGTGTARLWTHNSERSTGVIRSPGKNSICCAQFNVSGPQRIAIACADSNVYLYDLRRLDCPLLCLRGHGRAASYVRFLNEDVLVSSSIDSTVKLWDVSMVSSSSMTNQKYLLKTYASHRNVKNFVGLAVSKEGLVCCGSESNEMFVYDKSATEPIWRMHFPAVGSRCSRSFSHGEGSNEQCCNATGSTSFVGAVCWKEQVDHLALVGANSDGMVQAIKVNSASL